MTPNVLIIGAGMYVLGRDDKDLGTILPTLLQEQAKGEIGEIFVASSRLASAKAGIEKLKVLASKLQVGPKVKFFPMAQDNQEEYLKIAKETKNLVAIVAVPDHLHFKITNDLLDLGIATMWLSPSQPPYPMPSRLQKRPRKKSCSVQLNFTSVLMRPIFF